MSEHPERTSGAAATLAAGLLVLAGSAGAEITVAVVDADGAPLANAVVTARIPDEGLAETPGQARILQRNQQFEPRVTVVRRGSSVRFPNTDITQHHVYSFSSAKTFELELYSGDDAEPVRFDTGGIVALGCNIHDWMLGYVYVTDDAAFGVSDASGELTLPVEPDALSALDAWHPALRTNGPQTIEAERLVVQADGSIRLTLDTRDDDPLEFEIDPLQALFDGSGR